MKKKQMSIILSANKQKVEVKPLSKTKKQLLAIIKKHVKDMSEHFKSEDGGWKLDKDFITSSILYDVFEFSLESAVNYAFINEGLAIEYARSGSFVRTKEDYIPIYMNVKTGKLILVENSDDKSYLNKFSDRNGYCEIGKL
jgi:hypothetical protein